MWREGLSTDAEAFGVLASETRLRILQAVAFHWQDDSESVPYSTLLESVGIEDSGKFNYHLDKLRDRFVLEQRGGYTLTAQAQRALDSLLSKRYHDVENDRVPVEGHCPICGGGFEVGCHWNFYLGCSECWEPHVYRRKVSPRVLEHRDWREVMIEYERAFGHKLASMLDGVCIECGGPTGFTFHRLLDPYEEAGTTMKEFTVAAYCPFCTFNWTGTVGQFLLAHPEVRAYCEDHDIDLWADPFWTYEWVLTDLTTVARSEDPWRVEKTANVDGCRLAVVFDDDGSVDVITHVDLQPDTPVESDEATDRAGGRVDRAEP